MKPIVIQVLKWCVKTIESGQLLRNIGQNEVPMAVINSVCETFGKLREIRAGATTRD